MREASQGGGKNASEIRVTLIIFILKKEKEKKLEE